jgi:hypothetical protein
MPARVVFTLAVAVVSFGCSSHSDSRPDDTIVREPTLTADLAKQALVDRMRSKSGDHFEKFDSDEWAKVAVQAGEDGWYNFGGLFGINPSTKSYTLLIMPALGAKACSFEYEGTFSFRQGRWVADAPKLVRTALQGGKE